MLKDDVLLALLDGASQFVSGEALARRFSVTRMAVNKAVSSLKGEGCDIEIIKNRGYRLLAPSDKLSSGRISRGLRTKIFGRVVEILQTVTSTNTALKERDLSCLPQGFTLLSEEQTGGRGRFGRSFLSPAGGGIYMSVLLKPEIPSEEAPFLTLLAAVAVSRAVETASGLKPGIKWVNDLYLGGRKLVGILTEGVFTAETGTVESVVCGIGVNTGEVAEQVRDIATSIFQENGKREVRNLLTAEILNELETVYTAFLAGEKAALLSEYREKLMLRGCLVSVSRGIETFPATVLDINESGGLVVQRETGEVTSLSSGEVSIKNLS